MSPSMEKERVDHQVLTPVLSGTEPDRNTVAAYQIRLAAFFGISVYKRLERCVGTHPEKLWVKIPNYFCLSAYIRKTETVRAAYGGAHRCHHHPRAIIQTLTRYDGKPTSWLVTPTRMSLPGLNDSVVVLRATPLWTS